MSELVCALTMVRVTKALSGVEPVFAAASGTTTDWPGFVVSRPAIAHGGFSRPAIVLTRVTPRGSGWW